MEDVVAAANESDKDALGTAARIARAAEREAARDRRVLWLYLALAIVPVALAVAFLKYGRTDRRIIENEIAPVKVQLGEVQPALQEVRQLRTVAAQLRGVGDVAGQMKDAVAKIDDQGRELARLKDTTATVGAAREEESRKLDQTVEALRSELATIKVEQENIHRSQLKLQSDVEVLKRRPGGDIDLESLTRRLSAIEGRLAPVERDLRDLRRRQPGK